MPYESLTCPKCGSADCQEVKPGTHFCNHCDNVFRYVTPAGANSRVAACTTCGVLAVGRCVTCSQAFCASHQGRDAGMVYVDQCVTCRDRVVQDRRDHEARFGRSFFSDGSARRTLLDAGVATVDFHRVRRETQSLRFGRYKEVVTVEPLGRGWLLGMCPWKYTSQSGRSGVDVQNDQLTILQDTDRRAAGNGYDRFGNYLFMEGLFPVREDTTHGGYEYVDLVSPGILGFGVHESTIPNWESLSRRVHDLSAPATSRPGHPALPAEPR